MLKIMPNPVHRSSFIVHRNNKKGFTILELLVTITIMAIIASIGFVSYAQTQKAGRDARRKQDIRAIAVALEVYRQKNNRYPCVTAGVTSATWTTQITDTINNCDSTQSTNKNLDTEFINKIPIDPLKNDFVLATGTTYGYSYQTPFAGGSCPSTEENYYELVTRLENINDSESCKNKVYKRCNGTYFCDSANQTETVNNTLFVITSEY